MSMDNAHRSRFTRLAIGVLVLLSVVLADCSSSSAPKDEGSSTDSEVVCPSCHPIAGGETGDFGASTAICVTAYVKREVDRAEADALGFSASAAVHAIEKPIDAAMTWTAIDSDGGGPARGYDERTQVHVALEVESLTYYEFDPERCDGDTDCVEQGKTGVCAASLVMVNANGELRTEDGAVNAELPAQNVHMLLLDDDDISVASRADLRKVHGSLQLDSDIPEPTLGALDLSLQYSNAGALQWGEIDISIFPDWDHLPHDGPQPTPGQSHYAPLQGRWGSAPSGTPIVGQPEP
jgi:hypothetical protein